ncbi:hypothetical protein N5W20_07290 [Candidatus Kirkpatrickella diaphorinae]|uniref:Uncharacterized protein n=1 Tax=Candidatus Kirkpatrickella diaphorinae TaxID=2984322 RepID=A0ABY6GHV9_9PROT|nr:hypothetical protein [Candidatus Kirkpatrickella diaphorinae]UYH50904.1 hypothetical protein N5W20_07290 [Candidatus Kirkpatrickella diaphorinae]
MTSALASLSIGHAEDTPLFKSQLNQPDGVAGLNADAHVTAPIETEGDIKALGHSYLGRLYSGQPAIMQGVPRLIDGAVAPTSILLGGIGYNDFAPTKITSPLIGPNDFGGCVLSVNDSPFEQYSRCGTGFDESIGVMEKVQNRPPRLALGQDISGAERPPSGATYNVFFEGTDVKIRPALAKEDAALLVPQTRIYANYYNGMVNTRANGSNDTPALWYSYIWNWSYGEDAQGSYTQINVSTDPYNLQGGWMHNTPDFSAVRTNIAPGQNQGDLLDHYVSSYSHAAAFIGQVGKKFVVNSMIQLDANVPDSPTLAAEGEELDLQLLDTAYWAHEKKFTVHGKTITLTGMDHPADDSYLERLAGTNLIKTGLKVDGIIYGGRPISASDSGFHLHSEGDLEAVKPGDSQLLLQVGSMNLAGVFSSLLLYGSHDHAWSPQTSGWGEEGSLHLGLQEKADQSVMAGTTVACSYCTSGGQIVWNPIGYHYGIGIGVGFGTNMKYGVLIKDDGMTVAPNGLTAQADIRATGNITSDGVVSAAAYIEKLSTPASSSAPCQPGQFSDDAHYHYVCVATNNWKRVALEAF